MSGIIETFTDFNMWLATADEVLLGRGGGILATKDSVDAAFDITTGTMLKGAERMLKELLVRASHWI